VNTERAKRGSSLASTVALLAAALLLSPVGPFPLLAIPFALLLAAFRPKDLFGIGAAIVLLVLVFRAAAWEVDAGWYMLRGWCLLAGGLFVGATALRRPDRLLDRSFIAVAISTVLLAAGSFVWPELGPSLDGWMSDRIGDASNMAHAILLSDPQVASGALGDSISSAIDGWAAFQHDVYPALLALATMAALAVGWYFAGRQGEGYERPPPVREFGFRDGYVWLLVAGLALLVLPLGAEAFRAGENAALFMTLLYLARGGAILVWIAAAVTTSAWTWVLLAVCALLAYPFVFGAALVLGIGDTWLHLRERFAARAANGPGR
jgi:hypothetical protein